MGRRASLVLALLACACVLFPAAANAASAKTSTPVVTSVSPKRVEIGKTITIKGRNFVRGRNKNSVVFSNSKRAAIFVTATKATRTKLSFKLPEKLAKLLGTKNGVQAPTRLRLRVVSKRAGARLTPTKLSPIVLPASGQDGGGKTGPGATGPGGTTAPGKTGTAPTTPVAPPPCTSDNDLLSDDLENAIGTDRCKADTDGDGITDDWEYQSALDWNGAPATPYPGRMPYPNPLDPADHVYDYDGDGITNAEEYAIWNSPVLTPVKTLSPLSYSGGKISSLDEANADGAPYPNLANDQRLTDDERDADGDGLNNWDEIRGRLSLYRWAKWTELYTTDGATPMQFLEPDYLLADSDGDGLLDGADDQDRDDVTNLAEVTNPFATSGAKLYRPTDNPDPRHPFDPCKPDPLSPKCQLHPPE
jgi:IPT/TIG domain/Bacterial TSP3 repeat